MIYALAITSLSLKTHVEITDDIYYNDKVAHILGYALFTLLAARISPSLRHLGIACILLFLYSGLIEILQSFTGRSMSILDLVANGVGITAMFLIVRPLAYAKDS